MLTMIGKFPLVRGVHLADIYEPYPMARMVFPIAVVVFLLFNFGSWLGAVTSHPVYARWLNASQPFTDAVAHIFPGVDSSTTHLQARRADMIPIPAVRNLLSINFSLFLFFPSCFAAAACIDLLKDRERVLRSIDAVSKRIQISIWEVGVRAALFVLIFFPFIYFGLATDPYASSLAYTIVYYVVVFGGTSMCLIVAISSSISCAVADI